MSLPTPDQLPPVDRRRYDVALHHLQLMMDFHRIQAVAVPAMGQDWPAEIVNPLGVLPRIGHFSLLRNGTMKYDGFGFREGSQILNSSVRVPIPVLLEDLPIPVIFLERVCLQMEIWSRLKIRSWVRLSQGKLSFRLLLQLARLEFLA